MHGFFQSLWQMLTASNLPGIIGGIIILLLGWAVAAWISRGIARRMCFCGHDGESCACGKAGIVIARVVFYLLLLVVLTWALAVMKMDFAAGTLREFLLVIAGYLPHLAGALILAAIAWAIAGMARNITRKMLTNWHAGEKIAEHTGNTEHSNAPEKAAQLVYYIVYLFFIPAILDALKIHGVTEPLARMFEKILFYLPNLLAAAVVIIIALFFGKIVGKLCCRAASAIGFDRFTGKALGREFTTNSPSVVLGKIVFIAIMVFAVLMACEALNLMKLAELVAVFAIFGGNLLLSAVVLLIGFRLAELAASVLKGKCSATVAGILQAAIMFFSVALALSNLDVGGPVVLAGFTLILGAVCLAAAIAFGVGGREVAARFLEERMNKRKE